MLYFDILDGRVSPLKSHYNFYQAVKVAQITLKVHTPACTLFVGVVVFCFC